MTLQNTILLVCMVYGWKKKYRQDTSISNFIFNSFFTSSAAPFTGQGGEGSSKTKGSVSNSSEPLANKFIRMYVFCAVYYAYVYICISSGQGWPIAFPCPEVASRQPQALNQTCLHHSIHARAHHRFGHACQTLHAGWVYHAWVHECLSFHAWSLVHFVLQPVSSTRELQARPTLSEGMLSHASCHMHESSPHLATPWVQVLGNYACMHAWHSSWSLSCKIHTWRHALEVDTPTQNQGTITNPGRGRYQSATYACMNKVDFEHVWKVHVTCI